jgi:DNA primase
LEKLAKEAGIELKKVSKNPNTEKLELLNRKATEYFYKELLKKENSIALKYLKDERQFTKETIDVFALGFAPGKRDLEAFLRKAGIFSRKNLLDSGLFTEKNGIFKEKFFKRIMFPIRNSQGKFIGFSGRILPGNDFGPKYMNTPETPVFHKKENLFGLYESRLEIRKQDFAILCEGQTDVISAYQNGIKNIVAPLGTALTKEQLEKLSKLTKNILFFFDSDDAGKKATVRGFKMASELNLYPFAANSKPYKDLDEMIKKDLTELRKRISERKDAFSYLLLEFVESRDLTNYKEYNQSVNFVKDLLSSVKNISALNFYKKKAEKILGTFDKNITQEISKKITVQKPLEENASHEKEQNKEEEVFLQLILLKDSIKLPKDTDLNLFFSEEIKKILRFIQKNPGKTRQEIFANVDSPILEDLIFSSSRILNTKQDIIEKDIKEIYGKIKDIFVEKQKKKLNVKIAIAEERKDLKESEKLLEEYQNLIKIGKRSD